MVQKLFLLRQMAGGCQLTGLTGPDLEHSLLVCLPHREPATRLMKSAGSSSETCSEEAELVFCPPASTTHLVCSTSVDRH